METFVIVAVGYGIGYTVGYLLGIRRGEERALNKEQRDLIALLNKLGESPLLKKQAD